MREHWFDKITAPVDRETYWLICARAEELETTPSELASELLSGHAREGSEKELAARRERAERLRLAAERLRLAEDERLRQKMHKVIDEIRARGGGIRKEDRLTREELHDRDRARREAREWYEAERRVMLRE